MKKNIYSTILPYAYARGTTHPLSPTTKSGNERAIERIAMHSEVSEKEIEKHLRKRVKDMGGLCLKYSNPAEAGYPDRLVVLKGGCFFVELKSKGEKPTKLQRIRMAELDALGTHCFVCDSKAKVDEAVETCADLLGL